MAALKGHGVLPARIVQECGDAMQGVRVEDRLPVAGTDDLALVDTQRGNKTRVLQHPEQMQIGPLDARTVVMPR